MVTFTNYETATKKIDWSVLPEVLKRTHNELIPDAKKGAYENDADVKRVVDSYIAKLNAELVKNPKAKGDTNGPKKHERTYTDFEGDVTSAIEKLLNVTRSDAQGIVEAQNFYMQQSWTKGLSVKETAELIKSKSKVEKPKKKEQTTSKKSAKPVERIDDEITLIKRFIGLNGKTKTRDQVMNVLRAVQKAMLEKRVNKNSLYAAEVDQIQLSLIGVVNTPAKTYELKIDPKRLERYKEISESVEKMVSIGLLKRYVGLEGRTGVGVYEKGQRLRNDILRAISTGKVAKTDKYYSQLLHAERNIERSPRSPYVSTVQLNGFKELWTGAKNMATKVASGAKKIASGTKKAYRVVKASGKAAIDAGKKEHQKVSSGIKKLTEGAKAIFTKKDDPRYSARVRILKYFPDDNTYKAIFLTVPSGSGWSVGEEDFLQAKHLIPGTKENLGFIPEMIAAAAGALVQKGAKAAMNKNKPLSGVMDLDQLKDQQFEKIGLLGEWKKLIGDACKPTSIFIYGPGGSGKSTVSFRLCEVLNNLGNKILYVAGEQFGTPALKELLTRLNLNVDKESFLIVKDIHQLNPADFDFVVLDSKDACGFKHSDQFEAFKNKYPKQSFIITSEGLKNKSFKGDEAWRNKVDTMIYCEGYVAKTDQDKNRWGGSGQMKLS